VAAAFISIVHALKGELMRLFNRTRFGWCAVTRFIFSVSASLLVVAVLVPDAMGQTNDSAAGSECVSAKMVGLIAREGNSVRVSLGSVLVSQKAGSHENEKGIALTEAPETARTMREAHQWFEKGARKGYAPAEVNLAVLSLAGWGAPPNAGTALYWLREAARQGYALAYFDLGVLYMNGCGVRQDYGEAFQFFEEGANAGDSAAQMNVGYLFDRGMGVAQDRAKAAAWYRKAAENGVAQAENNLGDLYLRGEGVPRDERAAFAWFQKAAQQGHTGARIMLGSLYAEGRGTDKNVQAAYEWISAAILQGDTRGSGVLRELEQQLSAEQVAQSKVRAAALAKLPNQQRNAEVALLHKGFHF
jgi:uncharacterized protein